MSVIVHELNKPDPPLIERFFSGKNTIDNWDRLQISNYQNEALSNIIRYASENNLFYKNKFSKACGNQDLSYKKIPFLTKREISGRPGLLLSSPREDISQTHISTGTTGSGIVYIDYSWQDLFVRSMGPSMPKLLHHLNPDDIVLNALPYELSSAGLAFHRVFQKACGACVVSVGKGGAYSNVDRTIRVICDVNPTIIITTPSHAVKLYESAQKKRILSGLNTDMRFMWLTGEGCSDAFRKRVEKLWSCPCYFYYGSLEVGPIGIECVKQQGLHMAAGHVFIEVVDPVSGEGLPPGEIGEIVVTDLVKETTPIIKYRTGDLGFIDDTYCSCGISLPKIQLRGRQGDQLVISGKEISPYYVEELMMRIDEIGYWYQLYPAKDSLLIKVELKQEIIDNETVKEKILSQLEYYLDFQIKIEIVKNLPRTDGKIARVIRREIQ